MFLVQRYENNLIFANLLTFFMEKILAVRFFFTNFAVVNIYIFHIIYENGHIQRTRTYSGTTH